LLSQLGFNKVVPRPIRKIIEPIGAKNWFAIGAKNIGFGFWLKIKLILISPA